MSEGQQHTAALGTEQEKQQENQSRRAAEQCVLPLSNGTALER